MNEEKHWFRAKFFQQYRLFFRYHAGSKVVVFAWVNDENTLRSSGSKSRSRGARGFPSAGGQSGGLALLGREPEAEPLSGEH